MDPMTVYAMLQLGSVAIQGISGIISGNEEANALERQAQIDRENARLSLEKGEADVAQVRERGSRFMGEQTATIAQSGLGTGGTNAALAAESARGIEKDVGNTRREAALRAAGFQERAAASDERATQSRKAGYVGGFNALLSGASEFYGNKRALR